jgi:hypothetical protein
MLEDNGLVHRELELLTNWWADGALRVQSDSVRRGLLAAAEALGADHIKIGPPGSDSPWDPDRWAGELAALAAEAAEAGARVGLEFLPWTAIKTVHDGMELVESAGHPAAGLIIDVWHTERTHTPAAELATIPLWRIVGVELSDADEQCIGTLSRTPPIGAGYVATAPSTCRATSVRSAPPAGPDPGASRSCRRPFDASTYGKPPPGRSPPRSRSSSSRLQAPKPGPTRLRLPASVARSLGVQEVRKHDDRTATRPAPRRHAGQAASGQYVYGCHAVVRAWLPATAAVGRGAAEPGGGRVRCRVPRKP